MMDLTGSGMAPSTGQGTIDFTIQRGWGHEITWVSYDEGLRISGRLWHTPSPRTGDWLALPKEGEKMALYRIIDVHRFHDPSDMYAIVADFVPATDAPTAIPECRCQDFWKGTRHG